MSSRRILSILMVFLLFFSGAVSAFGNETSNGSDGKIVEENESDNVVLHVDVTEKLNAYAETLYRLGLFSGDGTEGFNLDGTTPKVHAAILVTRLIGDEYLVTLNKYGHYYNDVPEYASSYIGYLQQNGIDIARNNEEFGSNDPISVRDFVQMLLQAMGFDGVSRDSTDEEVFEEAEKVGLLNSDELAQILPDDFTRGEMVYVSIKALDVVVSSEEEPLTLYEKLQVEGALKNLDPPSEETVYGIQKVKEDYYAELAQAMIDEGSKYLGMAYRSAGRSPSTGFDCSGYVGYIMIQTGVWDRFYGSCDGIATQCTRIEYSEARPGDLVLFTGTYYNPSRTYTHVAIYIGDGKVIHSASNGVCVSDITSGYWRDHFSCIARQNVLM